METFTARVFSADLPVVGEEATALFTGSTLSIPSLSLTAYIDEISMRVGGFEHNEFLLDWQTADGTRYSLKPATKEDVDFVIANAPPPLNLQFKKWHQRNFSIRFVWGAIAGAVATLAISAVLLWVNYDAALDWVVAHISIENEQRLGQSVLDQLKADGDLVSDGLAVDTITKIGDTLTIDSDYTYQWFVMQDPTVNAFALPGGIVVVNSELIKVTENADELAAVLAHEVQHIEQRHSLKNMVNSLGWAAGLMIVLGDVNVATAVIAHQLGNMYFSRDKEQEADRLGFYALTEANIAPEGMVGLLKKLGEQPGADIPAWLSTHPETEARIDAIETLLLESPCVSCESLPINWAEIQADSALTSNSQGDA